MQVAILVQIEPPSHGQQGDHVYRTEQPLRALALAGVPTMACTPLAPEAHALMREAEVLVLCLSADADYLPILAERRQSGKPTFFELNDDFCAIQPWNQTAGFFQNPHAKSLIFALAQGVNAVQTSMPALATRFAFLEKPMHVFPNQLWQVPDLMARHGPVRLGWAGSLGHLRDIELLVPVLQELLRAYPELELGIMASDEILHLFAGFPTQRTFLRGPGSLSDYLGFLQTLHIGLCPLLDTGFNRCRSDVKFLEYAAQGVVAVCADAPPYRDTVRAGETGYLYRDDEELKTTIGALISDPKTCQRARANAHAYVRDHRDEQAQVTARLAAYGLPPAASTQYSRAEFGRLQSELYNGLLAMAQDPREALGCFRRAIKLRREFYLPHLYAAQAATDPERAIGYAETALTMNPKSVNAWAILAARHAAMGRQDRAEAALRECTRVAPAFSTAWVQLGFLRTKENDGSKARECFETALRQNPFDVLALRQLAQLDLEHAPTRALERASALVLADPWSSDDQLLLARVHLELGNKEAARACLERAKQV